MAPVPCSVPDCSYVTPEATDALMVRYLEIHNDAVHPPAAVVSKLPWPVFSLNMTEAEWQLKEAEWNSYIEQTPCSEDTKRLQLKAACDDSLRKRVKDSGGWDLGTIPLVLARIKELAVIHKSLHLMNLDKMVQQPDENIGAFTARLTGTAEMCGMSVKCNTCQVDISYRDEVVKQKIITGMFNPNIKERVLRRMKVDELPTLSALVEYIAAEETSVTAASEAAAAAPESSGTGACREPEYLGYIRAILGDIEIPEGVDLNFLAALRNKEMMLEVIEEQRRLLSARQQPAVVGAGAAPSQGVQEVNPEFLAALPPEIQEEVLKQHRIEQLRLNRGAKFSNKDTDVDLDIEDKDEDGMVPRYLFFPPIFQEIVLYLC